jgi:Glycosyltransferase
MKRILIFGMTEVAGGVESFLMNYYRHIDRKQLQFDFLCNSHNPIAYEDEILAMGGRTYHITARSKNYFQYHKELTTFFKEDGCNYDVIWVNVNSLANIDYLKMAKKYGIHRRIIHSHNSLNMDSGLRGLLHKYNKNRIQKYATDFWACSKSAAEWFYPKYLKHEIYLINDSIDVEKMSFSVENRERIRKQLFENKIPVKAYIVGNVGRLHFQKNQKFVIEVFFELVKKIPEAELLLIGKGPDEMMLKEYVNHLHLEDKVHFLGEQHNIQDWLSAMDLFLFPSLFEGFGMAALEAEANGLPVLMSEEASSSELNLNDYFHVISIKAPIAEWVDEIIKVKRTQYRVPYERIREEFKRHGFDVIVEADKLERKLMED